MRWTTLPIVKRRPHAATDRRYEQLRGERGRPRGPSGDDESR